MSDKAMQAARESYDSNVNDPTARVVRAYLTALAEDPEAVKGLAKRLSTMDPWLTWADEARTVLADLRDNA